MSCTCRSAFRAAASRTARSANKAVATEGAGKPAPFLFMPQVRATKVFVSREVGEKSPGQVFFVSDGHYGELLRARVIEPALDEPISGGIETAVIVAGGPSAGSADLEPCRQFHVVAVNDAYRLCPWAQALYACDPHWWDHHHAQVKQSFSGECWTQDQETARKYGLKWIQGYHSAGLSKSPNYIHFNSNSGAQAINLAVIWGAKRLILVGFDMKMSGGKRHWFGEHPGSLNKASDYRDWVQKFAQIAKDLKELGVECFNASPDSALTCFERVPLADICRRLRSTSESRPSTGERHLPPA